MEQVNSAYCSPEFPLTASVSFFPVCDQTTLYLHLYLYLYLCFLIIVIGCPGCFLNKWSIVHIVVLLVAHHYPLQFPWISIGNKSNMWSRHITIQILSRIALEHTISNTNNIRVFFSGYKMFEKRFYCKWLKVSKIIVTDSLCQILSMSLPICQFHCLSVCQVSKKY